MNKAFEQRILPMFGNKLSAPQREGIRLILAATEGLPLKHRAYILATAKHETGSRMQPVREAYGTSDDDVIRRLDKAWARGVMPWVRAAYWRKDRDGKAWYGRGHVQLTHRDNYARMGKRLGVDLVANPDAALNPELSARIMVVGMTEGLFTGLKLSQCSTYSEMRRVVNGTDRAALIANYALTFETALNEVGPVIEAKPEPRHAPYVPKVPAAAPTAPAKPAGGLFGAILDFLSRILGGRK